jgi:hypothetical protein
MVTYLKDGEDFAPRHFSSAFGFTGSKPPVRRVRRAEGGSVGDEPPDMSGQYNTPLSPDEEARFQAWAASIGHAGDTREYDLRGAFKSGVTAGADGHFPDTYKKPNHPTFSSESQYSVPEAPGGTWSGGQNGEPWKFTPSEQNLRMRSPAQLQRYFREREPANQLDLPTSRVGSARGGRIR